MCGIAGKFNYSPEQPLNRELVQQMTRLIAYRGPDDEGFYFDRNIGLGNRRLIIIDTKGGHQPIHNEDNGVWVTFNGEVYNYLELRDHLRARGHNFYTHSDTEVIVHLYEEYGARFVEKINGMFAIALWDSKQRILYLYRDRLGVKPIYFGETEDGVVFASEIKCLLLDAQVDRSLDDQSLFDLLSYGYVPPPGTLFKGVKCLLPGQFASCSAQGVSIEKYWDIPLEVDESRSEEQYEKELIELLTDATRLRLRSDVPLGAFLSGGLDSSTVVALASGLLDEPLLTFSVGFKEETFNELPYARVVSQLYSTRSHEMIVEADLASLLPLVVWYTDQPHGDASFMPMYAMAQLASKHATVLLNGDGGDELFGGYSGFADFLTQTPAPGVDPVRAYYNTDHITVYRDIEKEEVFSREYLGSTRPQASDRILREVFARAANLDFASGMFYADQKLLLPGNNLIKPDRMGSPQPIECRSPFLDYRVAELAARMPSRYKVRGKTTKYLLKNAVRSLFPPEIIDRPKQMFTVPIGEWFRGRAGHFVRETLHSDRFCSRGILNIGRVHEMLKAHQLGSANYTRQLRLLVNLELWFQIFMDTPKVSEPTELVKKISASIPTQGPQEMAMASVHPAQD